MPKTPNGSRIEVGATTLTMASGAASAVSVSFRKAFPQAPEIFLVHHLGDEAAVLTAGSITATGFQITVASSGLPDGEASFEWVAVQKS